MTPLGTAQSRTGRRRRLFHFGRIGLSDLQRSGRLCSLHRLHRLRSLGNRSVGQIGIVVFLMASCKLICNWWMVFDVTILVFIFSDVL